MAFWGVEVKPGKPYVHEYDEERGAIHVSQATLGNYSTKKATKRAILQCNVGDKEPIYLCSLLPEKNETCPLNLEFDDGDEVTFSVVGPHSVHLSGFFSGNPNSCGPECDNDGEDIYDSESEDEESGEYDSEDDDDMDFIDDDDDDMDMFRPSAIPNSGVRIEEIIDDETPANGNGTSQRPKKKKNKQGGTGEDDNSQGQIVVKSSTDIPIIESEDEDGFPISSQDKRKDNVPNTEMETEGNDKGTEEGVRSKKEKHNTDKRKIHGDEDELSDREADDKQTRRKKKKAARTKEENLNELGEDSKVEETSTAHIDQTMAVENKSETEQTTEKEKKKKNKKKKKKQDTVADANLKQNLSDNNGSIRKTEDDSEDKPVQQRSYPNGLVVETLQMGSATGKKAELGKKVSVHYIGKLQKNGKIFDSNIGKAPFKFRLGVGQVIKGWDVGVKGMRIGDKRRLTIPPSMGYGAKGAAGAIPPNAWLVFDVELVDVS